MLRARIIYAVTYTDVMDMYSNYVSNSKKNSFDNNSNLNKF